MRVFRLIEIEIDEGRATPDGILRPRETPLGVFSSPENAEAMIRTRAEWRKDSPWCKVLGYLLFENELDDMSLHGPWKQTPEFLSVRSYFADGRVNAFCDCDDTSEKHWHGRAADTIRYKPGDYVSVLAGDIVPALIGGTPREEGTIDGDWTDDCYLAYSAGTGHWHPFTPYVFPLARKLPKRVKARIEAERDEWEGKPVAGAVRRKAARRDV